MSAERCGGSLGKPNWYRKASPSMLSMEFHPRDSKLANGEYHRCAWCISCPGCADCDSTRATAIHVDEFAPLFSAKEMAEAVRAERVEGNPNNAKLESAAALILASADGYSKIIDMLRKDGQYIEDHVLAIATQIITKHLRAE